MYCLERFIKFCVNTIWKLFVPPITKVFRICLKILLLCFKEILKFFIPSDLVVLSVLRDFERFIFSIPSKMQSIFISLMNMLRSNTSKEWIRDFKTGSNRALIVVASLFFINIIIFVYYSNSYFKHTQTHIETPIYLQYPHPHLLSIHSQKLLASTETINSATPSSPEVQYFYPHAYIPIDKLTNKPKPGEFYDVRITLDLPESYNNRELGMFMINVSLLNENLSIIKNAELPFLLSYSSSLFRYLKLLFLFPFYLFGFLTERQVLIQTMFQDFQENISNPLKAILITVSTHHVEVYSAAICFSLKPQGLDYLIINWPITSATILIALFGTIVVFISLIVFLLATFFTLDIVDKNIIRSQSIDRIAFRQNDDTTDSDLINPGRDFNFSSVTSGLLD